MPVNRLKLFEQPLSYVPSPAIRMEKKINLLLGKQVCVVYRPIYQPGIAQATAMGTLTKVLSEEVEGPQIGDKFNQISLFFQGGDPTSEALIKDPNIPLIFTDGSSAKEDFNKGTKGVMLWIGMFSQFKRLEGKGYFGELLKDEKVS